MSMAHKFPSIQSFFQSEIHTAMKAPTNLAPPAEAGDGFTQDEIEATLRTTLHKWQPRCEYPKIAISSLEPGSGCFELKGRVVNMQDEKQRSAKMPYAAKGCLKLIVRDDTGVISVCCIKFSLASTLELARELKQNQHLTCGK